MAAAPGGVAPPLAAHRKTYDYNGVILADRSAFGNHAYVTIGGTKNKENFLDDDGTTVIPQGSFTVIIGTSGTGKSLLMNAVSDTLGAGYCVEGDISLNPEQKEDSRKGGVRFVLQDDAVPLELTIEQVMQFASELRLSKKSLKERNDTINDVLRQVNLVDALGVKISKLSGGQRKRVSVAVDLLDYPQLLILDEPTSGLDAETELRLIELLKNISRQEGITVVCITHSLTACELADNIVVVGKKPGSETSCIRFSGSRDEIIKDAGVKELRDIYPLIATSSGAVPSKHSDSKSLGKAGRLRNISQITIALFSRQIAKYRNFPLSSRLCTRRLCAKSKQIAVFNIGLLSQWNTVFRRSWSKLWADWSTFWLTFSIPLGLGILVGLSQRDHTDSLSPYFFLVLSALWVGMSLTIRELIVERRIYVRDKKAGQKPSAYLWGKLMYAASISIFQVLLLYVPACLALVMCNGVLTEFEELKQSNLVAVFGCNPISHLTTVVVLFGVMLGGNMLGLIGSILVRTEQKAVLLQIFFLLPQILISRVAYFTSYRSQPADWHSDCSSLVRYVFSPLGSWLQRGMDTVSLFFVSRFGVSITEVTAIRNEYCDNSFCGDIFVEWIAFISVLALYAVVLWCIFKYKERRWGLR